MAKNKFTEKQREELRRQVYFMTVSIDAVEGLANLLPDAIDGEMITGEQVGCILKCIHYSMLSVQRDVVRTIEGSH